MPREVADALKKRGLWEHAGKGTQGVTPTAAAVNGNY
jgi:hypothetical protein